MDGYDPAAVTGTSCAVTGLVAETTYFFRVRATAGASAGPWSEAATVTTAAAGGEEPPADPYETWMAGWTPGTENLGRGDDLDGDGATNWEEYLADTDPTDSGECFCLTATMDAEGVVRVRPEKISTARRYKLLAYADLDAAPEEGAWQDGTVGMAWTNPLPGTVFLRAEAGLKE